MSNFFHKFQDHLLRSADLEACEIPVIEQIRSLPRSPLDSNLLHRHLKPGQRLGLPGSGEATLRCCKWLELIEGCAGTTRSQQMSTTLECERQRTEGEKREVLWGSTLA